MECNSFLWRTIELWRLGGSATPPKETNELTTMSIETTPLAQSPPAPCWADLSATERNNIIGDLIGRDSYAGCYMACDGKRLWTIGGTEAELPELRETLAKAQAEEKRWKIFVDTNPKISAEMRGKLTIEVERWHANYSGTPAGGWMVIEAMRPHVQQIFVLSCDEGEWEVMAIPANDRPEDITCKAATMQEAACELALLILPNATVEQPAPTNDNGI